MTQGITLKGKFNVMEITSLLTNISYAENHPSAQVLINNDYSKEIRIVFREGQEMKAHKAPYPIVIEVVDGFIDFGVDNQRHDLPKGSLISLESNVVHDLKASVNSIVRLSLYKGDQVERVQQAVKGN
ncbi:Cupin domain protein [Sphingobacterium nematocida]|uniref:Cupin domain protein n=2 Tax=Sphingobacterium nematocida TaxID=1513896 RepID=A0A1T5D0X9_9SPHI|nr:Cupin domain protein [Sphingobacterium nematocida]